MIDQHLSLAERHYLEIQLKAGLVSNSKCNTNRIGCCYEKTI